MGQSWPVDAFTVGIKKDKQKRVGKMLRCAEDIERCCHMCHGSSCNLALSINVENTSGQTRLSKRRVRTSRFQDPGKSASDVLGFR